MTRIRVAADYDAPPATVWAAVEQVDTHVDWMADAEVIRFVTDRTEGVGTRFECVTKVGPIRLTDRMEITEWAPGEAMGVCHTGLVTAAGFERGTGVMINVMPPETAAETLRAVRTPA